MGLQKFLKKAHEIEEEHSERRHEEGESSLKSAAHNHDESNWLVSYADMMTLLCGFFIMMFSMARIDDYQYEYVKKEIARQFGGDYKSQTEDLAKFVSQVLEESGVEKDTVLKPEPSGVTIVFHSTVFFETASSDIRPAGRAILERLITAVDDRQMAELKKYKIVVEGHTDSRPIIGGLYPSNWELSAARATRVVRMFLERGFDPERLTAIGYADTRPLSPQRTPAGQWDETALTKSRRVVIRILEPKVDSIPFAQPEAPGPAPGN